MKSVITFGILWFALGGGTAIAQEGAPVFPKSFDAPTVTKMISEVDKGTNFPVLKVGYFMGKNRPEWPVPEGLKLLQESVKKEKPASQRWFLMEWLRAFGTLRLNTESHDKAMVIYGDIFRAANGRKTDLETKTVRRVIDDFVYNVPTDLVTGRDQDTEFTEMALLEAAKCHFKTGSYINRSQKKIRPDFLSAVAAATTNERAWVELVDQAEKDKAVAKNFDFFFSAAQMIRGANNAGYPHLKTKVLTLLDQAEQMLKPNDPLLKEVKSERNSISGES